LKAIAELVDNSIQAVRDNPEGNKLVQIRLSEQALFVWDNGVGMSAEDLRKWATMGVSQSDSTDKTVPSDSHSDRGFISRFGVGAKRTAMFSILLTHKGAAFYLGKQVYVISKTADSQWVNSTLLSSVIHVVSMLLIITSGNSYGARRRMEDNYYNTRTNYKGAKASKLYVSEDHTPKFPN
jgi:hypothetical protein